MTLAQHVMTLTTAQILGQYRRELVTAGIPADELPNLIHMAARELVGDALRIGDPNACEQCGKSANRYHRPPRTQAPRVGPLPSD